ncbi:MAG: SO2930 family diheme c-type cytochrome [Bacteroidota bacterium]
MKGVCRGLAGVVMLSLMAMWGCGSSKQDQPLVLEEVALEGAVVSVGPEKLSDWGLFVGDLKDVSPAPNVRPYEISTPLFTDYAYKERFVRVPDGQSVSYHASEVLKFPEGSVLVKNFFYPADFAEPEQDIRMLETRLLINEGEEWKALTYVWNEDQTEAFLEVAGQSIPVSWTDNKGILQNINYAVPNLNQCKSCHEYKGRFTPIGPTARQLNRQTKTGVSQLAQWTENGFLHGMPADGIPSLPIWEDASSGTLDQRARAWLEVNCAHCHREEGPAKNTGLYLLTSQSEDYRLGIMKPPVAAGRGSANLKFGIVPGQPESSILLHRIQSLDPGVMMPELGRQLVHEEGVVLVTEWIRQM